MSSENVFSVEKFHCIVLKIFQIKMKAVCVLQGEAVSGTVYFEQVNTSLYSRFGVIACTLGSSTEAL